MLVAKWCVCVIQDFIIIQPDQAEAKTISVCVNEDFIIQPLKQSLSKKNIGKREPKMCVWLCVCVCVCVKQTSGAPHR